MTGENTPPAGPTGAGRGRRKPAQPVTVEQLDVRLRTAERLGDEHERRLNENDDWQQVVETGLVDVNDKVAGLSKANKSLADLVGKLGQRDEEEKKPKPVVSWLTVDADSAPAALADLEDWIVNVYFVFVGTRKAPAPLGDCWRRHPAVVERLLVLRDAHLVAYADGASPTLRLDWLNRHLPPTRQAVDDELRACNLAEHVINNPADFRPRRLTGADDFDDVTSWWVSSRGLRPEPTPTNDALAAESARVAAERQAKATNGY